MVLQRPEDSQPIEKELSQKRGMEKSNDGKAEKQSRRHRHAAVVKATEGGRTIPEDTNHIENSVVSVVADESDSEGLQGK